MLLTSSISPTARRRRSGAAALAVLLAGLTALATAGCGQEDSPARSLRIDAARDGALRFERTTLRTPPGPVAITMANPSSIPHAVGIGGNGVDESGETVNRDGTSRVKVTLESGSYTLFCPVAGHEQAGMTARLTVR